MPRKSDPACLNFEETELTLGLPGRSRSGGKRSFSDTVDLSLGRSKIEPRGRECLTDDYQESQVSEVAGKPTAAKAHVVGWPPVRSFRKSGVRSCTYVKVAVDGVPYLRKVDLEMYSSYPQLLRELEDMFACFAICDAEKDGKLIDPVNGTEYVPTYEDSEGDWMLVGDVPWK
ncbi:Iaa15p [Asimina triloba]